jgi:hypothetical protein
MLAPRVTELARARIGYYYRNVLLQSQRIDAIIGTELGQFTIETDYTISRTLTGLQGIPDRPRLSLLTNESGTSLHEITLRAGDANGKLVGRPGPIEVSHASIGPLVEKLREALSEYHVAPTDKKRSADDLMYDLQKLAPLGWKLYAPLSYGLDPVMEKLSKEQEHDAGVVIQVSRPTSATFTLPWNYLYDIPLSDRIPVSELRTCPIIDQLSQQLLQIDVGDGRCPRFNDIDHYENLLCPFGFWGFRHTIEQLSSTEEPAFRIAVASPADLVVGETQYDVDLDQLSNHIQELHNLFRERFPDVRLRESKTSTDFRQFSQRDVPIIYFYAHGERDRDRESEIYLGIGEDDYITANDFIGWVNVSRARDGIKVWNEVRPLIFINACHSLEITPETLTSYLNAFIGRANAAGVVGTEVKVDKYLAMEFAIVFFRSFLERDASIGQALRKARFNFLSERNLFGLAYNAHCWADLRIV